MNTNFNRLINTDSPFWKKIKWLYQKWTWCVEIYISENNYFVIIYDSNWKITEEKQFWLDDYNWASEEFEYQQSMIENSEYYTNEVKDIISRIEI
jgi:hypothetical protein